MKKYLSILLALVMVFSLMAPAAFADEVKTPVTEGSETVTPEPTDAPESTEAPEPTETPEVPTITVTPGNNAKTGKITLSWTAVDGAAKYEVYRSGSRNGTYTKYFTTESTSYTNTSSYAGYWYSYKVTALDAEGSEIVTSDIITHCADCAAPVITAGNNAKTGNVTLKWNAVSGADKYEIYRATSKDGEYTKMYTTTYTTYTNTTSKANVTYYYKVVALATRTSSANSAFSNIVARTCDCAAPVVTTGNNPTTGKITLKWKPVEGAAKYEVYRSGSQNGTYTKYFTTTGTSYTNTGAYAGYTYYYKVKAISAVLPEGNSAFSSVVSRTCDCAMPTLKLAGYDDDGSAIYFIDYNDNGNIVFEWGKVSGATSYKIYRSGSQNGTYKLIGETKNATFTDTTAAAGYYYYYRIIAVSSRTSYANSAAFEVVAAPALPTPKNLKGSRSSGAVTLKWDAVKGAQGYVIAIGESKDIESMQGLYTVEDTKVVDGDLPGGYWYAVIAYKYRSDGLMVTSMPAYVYVK